MSPYDAAWAAGLFDGEGYILASTRYSRHTKERRPDWKKTARLGLSMTDEDSVRRFHQIVGTGKVSGPRARGKNKPIWDWYCVSKKGVLQTLHILMPGLSERRRQAVSDLWENTSLSGPSQG